MGEIIFGKHTYGSPVRRGVSNKVTFGNYCSIAQDVILDGGFNHETRFISTYPFHAWYAKCSHLNSNITVRGDIEIGSDVWIGEGAIIMSGVKIGHGAVVGARALVTKDVPPYHIVGGIPAKLLRERFKPDQIESLLKIKWWDWSDEKVIENAAMFLSNSIEEFIKIHSI